MRIFDLSSPLDPASGDPLPPRIDYHDHKSNVPHLARLLGVPESEVPDGLGSATETVTARTHNGTHMDAPYHFFPTSEGRPARTIDEIPLEWCYAPGVVLDFSHLPPGTEISAAQVEEAAAQLPKPIEPGNIVFIRTDAYKYYHEPNYPKMHAGMSREATIWLIERGVKVMGIDAWSCDLPLPVQGERYLRSENKDPNLLWGAHRVGKEREYVHLEQLANLDKLPRPYGFIASVLPIKVARGSAGWVRAVAIFND